MRLFDSNEIPEGFYDEVYEDIPVEVRKKYKVVGTAGWVWDRIVSCVPVDLDAIYLEPCVGRGPGIKALLKAGLRKSRLRRVIYSLRMLSIAELSGLRLITRFAIFLT